MLFGLAERNAPFRLPMGEYTLWSRDRPWVIDNGDFPAKQTYGSFPIYMLRDMKKKNFHISYLLNSNAMDVEFYSNHST